MESFLFVFLDDVLLDDRIARVYTVFLIRHPISSADTGIKTDGAISIQFLGVQESDLAQKIGGDVAQEMAGQDRPEIDQDAFVTQANVVGVYGKGFDSLK